jgi:hypothetical protein
MREHARRAGGAVRVPGRDVRARGCSTSLAQSTIYKTRKSASSTWSRVLPLTVGSAFEFDTNDELRAHQGQDRRNSDGTWQLLLGWQYSFGGD